MRRPATKTSVLLVVLGVGAGVATALTVFFTHSASLHSSDPTARGALQAIVGLAALAAACTALLRATRTRRGDDLLVAAGLGLIVLNSTLLLTLTDVGAASSAPAVAWLPLPGRLAGATLLLAGAVAVGRRRRVDANAAQAGAVILLLALALAALGAGLGALRGSTAVGSVPQITTIALFSGAAVALVVRARSSGETELWWYGATAAALALTRAFFWLLPPLGPDWLSPGELARVLAAAGLLMVVQAELGERYRLRSLSTLEDERRRLAREFHDGLAQELAFIVNQSRRAVAGKADAESLELLAAAGQTALLEARQAIFKLNRQHATMLSTAIVEHTMRIADRAGLALDVEVDGEVPVDREAEHEILRIVGEAVSNAAKHANATRVSVSITSEQGRVIVRIVDDGDGFDVAAQRSRRHFGLVSMSERTRSLGGRLHLQSTPGEGTIIEVAI